MDNCEPMEEENFISNGNPPSQSVDDQIENLEELKKIEHLKNQK